MSFWKRFSKGWETATAGDEWAFGSIDSLRSEVARLKRLNEDQDRQIRDLLAANPMTDLQLEEIRLIRKDNEEMRREHNVVTIYLRTRFPSDFQSMRHGDRTFGEIVIFYLSRLLTENEAKSVNAKAPF